MLWITYEIAKFRVESKKYSRYLGRYARVWPDAAGRGHSQIAHQKHVTRAPISPGLQHTYMAEAVPTLTVKDNLPLPAGAQVVIDVEELPILGLGALGKYQGIQGWGSRYIGQVHNPTH